MSNWTDPKTWADDDVLTSDELNQYLRDNLDAFAAPGTYRFRLGTAVDAVETLSEDGWLQCNGVNVSRTTYPDLHAVAAALGYPFGSGDGSTTFGIPDCRGRDLKMQDTSGTFATLGATGGQESYPLDNGGLLGGASTAKISPLTLPTLDPYAVAGVWEIKT